MFFMFLFIFLQVCRFVRYSTSKGVIFVMLFSKLFKSTSFIRLSASCCAISAASAYRVRGYSDYDRHKMSGQNASLFIVGETVSRCESDSDGRHPFNRFAFVHQQRT